jgi:large subunit ribosomal protein L5
MNEIIDLVTQISGQKPVVNKAKKACLIFKVSRGNGNRCFSYSKSDRMWEFFDKLINMFFLELKISED